MIAYVLFVGAFMVSTASCDDISVVRRNLGDVDQKDSCNALSLVPREFWGAEDVEQNRTGAAKVLYVNMTNTGNCKEIESCSMHMSQLQRDDMSNGLPDINYNFVVGFAGNVYVGRDFNNTASRLERDDEEERNGIIIGIFGYQGRYQPPPPRTMAAVMNLVICGMDNGSIAKDVKIRHEDNTSDPCKGSLGERLQRMIASAYGAETAYNPTFECVFSQ